MGHIDQDIAMSAEEFAMIRDFIHERSGIYFADNKAYLIRNRLARRMADLDMKSVRDYFYHVKYDVTMNEFNRLMELITTNETSFFRNEPQLTAFADEVLPLILKRKQEQRGPKSLRIWSAGCSTGEEPYTLAIILLERMKTLAGWSVEIVANDISEQVLQTARRGEYAGLTLRNIRPEILTRYFLRRGDKYCVKPEVKALVKFSHMNLNDPRKISLMTNMDVIFCRNVMIYFSMEVKKQLVRGFYSALNPGGYLFIGHSETLHNISKAFRLVYFTNALVYQKSVEAGGAPARPAVRPGAAAKGRDDREDPTAGAARALALLAQLKNGNAGREGAGMREGGVRG